MYHMSWHTEVTHHSRHYHHSPGAHLTSLTSCLMNGPLRKYMTSSRRSLVSAHAGTKSKSRSRSMLGRMLSVALPLEQGRLCCFGSPYWWLLQMGRIRWSSLWHHWICLGSKMPLHWRKQVWVLLQLAARMHLLQYIRWVVSILIIFRSSHCIRTSRGASTVLSSSTPSFWWATKKLQSFGQRRK